MIKQKQSKNQSRNQNRKQNQIHKTTYKTLTAHRERFINYRRVLRRLSEEGFVPIKDDTLEIPEHTMYYINQELLFAEIFLGLTNKIFKTGARFTQVCENNLGISHDKMYKYITNGSHPNYYELFKMLSFINN